jgi:hypothetical protein
VRTHLIAITAGLALISLALFTIRVAQGDFANSVLCGFFAFLNGFFACTWYFGKDEGL